MDKFLIRGPCKIKGEVFISGSKNAALPVLASTLLFLLLLSSRPASTLALTDQKLIEKDKVQLPETARFFPKETSLSLHLMVNPKKIPEYFESTTSTKNKKEARERTENLIEGLFALTGLDYDKELSRWISSGVSLAIYQLNLWFISH